METQAQTMHAAGEHPLDRQHSPSRVLIQQCTSFDSVSQAQSLLGWEQSSIQIREGAFRGRTLQVSTGDASLFHEYLNLGVHQQFVPPAGHVVITMHSLLSGDSVIQRREVHRDSLILLKPGDTTEAVTTGGLQVFGISLSTGYCERFFPELADFLLRIATGYTISLTQRRSAAFRQLFYVIWRSLAHAADGGNAGTAQSGPEHSLLEQGLQAWLDGVTELLPRPGPWMAASRLSSSDRAFQRALDYMQSHYDAGITISDICLEAAVGRRSLQDHFRKYLLTSPHDYLLMLRLHEAARLLRSGGGSSITDIANRLHFANSSHFTRHYKKVFGELPSRVARSALPSRTPGTGIWLPRSKPQVGGG